MFNPDFWLVERKRFQPQKWLKNDLNSRKASTGFETNDLTTREQVEIVLGRIEHGGIDLTSGRSDWIKLGFAFATEFGEAGRGYFHRVSRFYPDYDFLECEKQYSRCNSDSRGDVTIGSFFWMAREAGVDIKTK